MKIWAFCIIFRDFIDIKQILLMFRQISMTSISSYGYILKFHIVFKYHSSSLGCRRSCLALILPKVTKNRDFCGFNNLAQDDSAIQIDTVAKISNSFQRFVRLSGGTLIC